MFDNMGPSGCGVYFFFASMMLLSIIFVFFLVPETKAVPLESMDRLFEARPVWMANKIILAEDCAMCEDLRHNTHIVGGDVAKDNDTHVENRSNDLRA